MKAWNELSSNEIIELLNDNEVIKIIQKNISTYSKVELCSGAIISIMKGEIPKDYDLLKMSRDKILAIEGIEFIDSSSTAETYYLKSLNATIQLLKRDRCDFEYTASQMYATISHDSIRLHGFDDPTFKSLKLIPVSYNRSSAINCLLRLPHWKYKGFTIPDKTYISLVRAATKTTFSIKS